MTDVRKLLKDYHSYSSGADSAAGARLHMTASALLAVLDECDRLEARRFLWVVLPIRRAINDALGIRDDTRREGYEYP